ncbi:hypothetical protein T439DRAFT_383447 [Meredithblackwellia eburnea MCA 4105]
MSNREKIYRTHKSPGPRFNDVNPRDNIRTQDVDPDDSISVKPPHAKHRTGSLVEAQPRATRDSKKYHDIVDSLSQTGRQDSTTQCITPSIPGAYPRSDSSREDFAQLPPNFSGPREYPTFEALHSTFPSPNQTHYSHPSQNTLSNENSSVLYGSANFSNPNHFAPAGFPPSLYGRESACHPPPNQVFGNTPAASYDNHVDVFQPARRPSPPQSGTQSQRQRLAAPDDEEEKEREKERLRQEREDAIQSLALTLATRL